LIDILDDKYVLALCVDM